MALVLTTKNKETKHHIRPKHKKETEKTALANTKALSPGLVCLLRPPARKCSGPYFTAPEPAQGNRKYV